MPGLHVVHEVKRSAARRGIAAAILGLGALVIAVRPGAAAGEAPPLLTDRPDFTETTVVVGRGFLQVEGGFVFSSVGAVSTYQVPELLLRTGIAGRLEARIGFPDYERVDFGGETDHRVGEGYFGAKLQLGPDEAPWGAALIPALAVPLDRDEKARPTPEMVAAWSRELPHDLAVGGILGHAWRRAVDRGPNRLFPTVSFSRPVGATGGVFLEWAAEFADGEPAAHLVHHGYTWALAPDLQVDVHGGAGLSGDTPDFFLGAGFAWRPAFR